MAIYRAEVIGSMLRPPYLKQGRLDFAAGRISTAQFKRLEDRAADEAIAMQQEAGLDIVTDGEMRRASFIAPLSEYLDGFEAIGLDTRRWHTPSAGETELRVPLTITGKLRRRRSLASEEFTYARARAALPLKVTLPSPLMLALLWSPEFSGEAYTDPFDLFADAVGILRREVEELASLGCEYIQVDAPEIATLVDPETRRKVYEAIGISTERMLTEGVDLLNAVADAPGVNFAIHFCRGNNAGHWMSAGGYESISKQVFTRLTRYETFLLEYDNWRSGSFEPLADIPRDKMVVLGLVSTKTDELEPAADLAKRVDEAARYFPREQMALSTQCGFASVAAGNPIQLATQEAKLRLVAQVAHRLWK
ncbi:MAG TPA: cobalamin-independent methionine synthase II family protein [Candidatus Binataceae bacterium]|nr:cobalamin-independent methionine synthase II family protein [Candidatus Binataceae bacterium]